MLLAQLKTPPPCMAGGCVRTVWQSVMVLASSQSFFGAISSFIQIYYSEQSYSLTGVHDAKTQVGPEQMSTLFYCWHLSASSFIHREEISSKWWREDRLPTSAADAGRWFLRVVINMGYQKFVTGIQCSQPGSKITDLVLQCNLGNEGPPRSLSVSKGSFLSSHGNELRLPLSALADRAPSLPDAVCWQIVFATRFVISVFYLWIHLIKIHSCRCKSIYHLSRLWQGQREDFYSCSSFALYFGLFSPWVFRSILGLPAWLKWLANIEATNKNAHREAIQ